jgi:hypothetical protein
VTRVRTAAHKTSFSDLYDEPDPRPYYRTLDHYDYQTPGHGQQAFGRLVGALRDLTGHTPVVADLCCSYGIMSALLTCDVTWDGLGARYQDPALDGLTPAQLAADDRAFYAARRRDDAPRVVGLDVARRAVAYGEKAGLLDPGFAENLEADDPSPALAAALAPVRLVTVSGGVSYITDRTIERLLGCCEEAPWIAAFVLRSYDYGAITAACARRGLVTERLDGRLFRQRRFASARERTATLGKLAELGRPTAPESVDGYYHTELYVSRPAATAAASPLPELLSGLV